MLKKINNKLYLDDKEIDLLNKYHLNYKNCWSLEEILFQINYLINNIDLDDDEYDEINEIAKNISERYYYNNINK